MFALNAMGMILMWHLKNVHNKAFKSDSQRLALSLRSSIAKRRSHLNAALCFSVEKGHISENSGNLLY